MTATKQYNIFTNPVNHPEGSITEALRVARVECLGRHEEEGGIILRNGEVFRFIKLTNRHTGTPTAVGFFEVDPQEYAEKILPLFNEGWKNYASFHTHPTGCRARPSMVDLTRLFNGFPDNYIWSPSFKELNQFSYGGEKDQTITWCLTYIPT